MAMMRLPQVTTTTTAIGTVGGLLTVGDTTGMARHAFLTVNDAAGSQGWEVIIEKVLGATTLLVRFADTEGKRNPHDIRAIPAAADVALPEQWVPDLYSDDAPASLSIPTK